MQLWPTSPSGCVAAAWPALWQMGDVTSMRPNIVQWDWWALRHAVVKGYRHQACVLLAWQPLRSHAETLMYVYSNLGSPSEPGLADCSFVCLVLWSVVLPLLEIRLASKASSMLQGKMFRTRWNQSCWEGGKEASKVVLSVRHSPLWRNSLIFWFPLTALIQGYCREKCIPSTRFYI